jgi:hypothetical protein
MPFAAAMIGVNMLEGITSAVSNRENARMNLTSIDEQIELLNKQRRELTKAYEEKKGIAKEKFGHKESYLRETTGDRFGDIENKYDVAASKTGLAFSGTVEYGRERETDVLKSGYEFTRENLYDQLGESLLNIEMEKTDKLGQIDAQGAGLLAQRKMYDEMSRDKFLGIF